MKPLKAEIHNFGSYSHLEFPFNDLGLALIHGATGSGKSTLQDIVPWILFGVTAKDGNADEIRSWTNPDEPTIGKLDLDLSDASIEVTRIRGKPSQNDLYWMEIGSDDIHRGKDLTETQKLLEQRLGVSKDLYIAGAYYNEFSPTGAFFTAKAKDRRELFEKLADLELPITLAERTSDVRKTTKKDLDQTNNLLARYSGRLESAKAQRSSSLRARTEHALRQTRQIDLLRIKSQNFETEKQEKIQKLEENFNKFEEVRNKQIETHQDTIEELKYRTSSNFEEYCEACGQINEDIQLKKAKLPFIEQLLEKVKSTENPNALLLEQCKSHNNTYNEQIETEETKVNPFTDQIRSIETEIEETGQKVSQLTTKCSELQQKIFDLVQLNKLSYELRRVLLIRAVKEIETSTNNYLEKYFDSELRVGFELEESDDLSISITKNGYPGVYRQMSKGQRGLLKLCFSVSVMKAAANRAGVHFGLLCFDEALDGLDADLKVKAFSLFQELSLSHESILVVEHSTEFKQQFEKSFLVTMENDESRIEEL